MTASGTSGKYESSGRLYEAIRVVGIKLLAEGVATNDLISAVWQALQERSEGGALRWMPAGRVRAPHETHIRKALQGMRASGRGHYEDTGDKRLIPYKPWPEARVAAFTAPAVPVQAELPAPPTAEDMNEIKRLVEAMRRENQDQFKGLSNGLQIAITGITACRDEQSHTLTWLKREKDRNGH